MAVAPKPDRTARFALPWLPLPAILGFALFGVGGSVFLAFTTFNYDPPKPSAAPSKDVPVYAARAIPFDTPREDKADRAASIARALTAAQTEMRPTEEFESQQKAQSTSSLLVAENRELRGFGRLANFSGANSYLAVTGMSFGIMAQDAPSGFMAPDAETFENSAVPEASTWICGGALFVLVAARGIRARWHRSRNRSDS